MNCTIHVVKTKALISFAVTAKVICVFVFSYAKSRFSHDAAHFIFFFLIWKAYKLKHAIKGLCDKGSTFTSPNGFSFHALGLYTRACIQCCSKGVCLFFSMFLG